MTDTLQGQQIVSSQGQNVEYIVQTGDSLAKIANVYYGSEVGWSKIHQANLNIIGDNPHELQVGLILNIPA
ncbi:MAG: LysM peptidoglycan-binding domain-containing protein [Nostochopsis sp.]